jgi:hypothetical protein
MSDTTNFRRERIEKLLHELRYEVERGLMEREIGEEMGFRFVFPISHKIRDGVVFCEFRTRPTHRMNVIGDTELNQPRLRVVK